MSDTNSAIEDKEFAVPQALFLGDFVKVQNAPFEMLGVMDFPSVNDIPTELPKAVTTPAPGSNDENS